MLRTFQALCAATFALAAVAAPAGAAEPARTQIEVRYADLNLDSPQGAQVLLRRLEHAAQKACGVERGQRGFAHRAQNECAARALDKAVAAVGSPTVAQAWAERAPTSQIFASR